MILVSLCADLDQAVKAVAVDELVNQVFVILQESNRSASDKSASIGWKGMLKSDRVDIRATHPFMLCDTQECISWYDKN